MYFVVTLALKILIYALVNCGFSGFASLKLHLFIQPLLVISFLGNDAISGSIYIIALLLIAILLGR